MLGDLNDETLQSILVCLLWMCKSRDKLAESIKQKTISINLGIDINVGDENQEGWIDVKTQILDNILKLRIFGLDLQLCMLYRVF